MKTIELKPKLYKKSDDKCVLKFGKKNLIINVSIDGVGNSFEIDYNLFPSKSWR